MRYGRLVVMAAAFSALPAIGSWAQPPTQATKQQAEPIGRVTAAFGVAAVETPDGVRKGDLNTLINNGDRVRTNGGGVTVLLASRVVLKIDHDTTIKVSESPDQLNVVLEKGTVHVFVGRRPLSAGAVAVHSPHARVETAGGVFLASYDPDNRSGYYACEHDTVTLENTTKTFQLSADQQLVVENGQPRDVEQLDRQAYNQRKQSLERLGQATKAHGAETFRMRSRMFDTDIAITQLSEAGWIDPRQLEANRQAAAKKKTGSAKTQSDSDSESDDEESNESSEPNAQQPSDPAQTDEPAPAEPGQNEPVLADHTSPPAAKPEVVDNGEPGNGGSSLGDGGRPAEPTRNNVVAPPMAAPGDGFTLEPEPDSPANPPAHGLRDDGSKPGKDKPDKVDRLDVIRPDHDNSGPGNSNGGENGNGGGNGVQIPVEAPDAPVGAPAETPVEPPVQPPVAPPQAPVLEPIQGIELEPVGEPISGGSNSGSSGSGSAAPLTPKIDLDLGGDRGSSSSSGARPIDLDIGNTKSSGGGKGAPVKVDLGLKDAGGGGETRSAPKVDLGLKGNGNSSSRGGDRGQKIDLGIGKGETRSSSGSGSGGGRGAAPKIDLGLKGGDKAPAAPKIDLDLNDAGSGGGGNSGAPGKVDLGLKDAAPPAPKIDLGLDVKPKIDAPAGNDVTPPTDVTPKLDLDKPVSANDIVKTDVELAPPPKLDLGLEAPAGNVGDITAPKFELDPKADAPTVDVGGTPGVPKLDLPTDVQGGGNLATDAVPAAGPLPTNDTVLSKDGAAIPSPGDLGVNLDKNAADAAKEAADLAKDAKKDRSGHDRNRGGGKNGKGGKGGAKD